MFARQWHHCYIITHWSRPTHECVSKLTTIGSDNGLSLRRRQPIIWAHARILFSGLLRTNFSEILIEIYTFPNTKMHLRMSSRIYRPFVSASVCLGFQLSASNWWWVGWWVVAAVDEGWEWGCLQITMKQVPTENVYARLIFARVHWNLKLSMMGFICFRISNVRLI